MPELSHDEALKHVLHDGIVERLDKIIELLRALKQDDDARAHVRVTHYVLPENDSIEPRPPKA